MYIHRNPIHHGFTGQYVAWEYSSYKALVNPEDYNKESLIKSEVLSLFGGRYEFRLAHEGYKQ